ncbi:DNA processing protein [Jatrophihabitans sp. GAS493]|uniref:DNA-processing protein DprA n=1 Tax=Jatrophihabitans sp. GAS493 TaxID=1907575 RepID=UPI000BB6AB3A|nr:DNA-processing protein DprA [Jatrophihabitans sp. GAS493]SOD74195.1 DNA processing protein [Jatrophihabitans sp. GAS493]
MGGVNGDRDRSEDVLLARAYLSRVSEPANLAVWAFVAEYGPLAAAEAIRSGDVPHGVARATAARRQSADPEQDLEAAAAQGIQLATPESPQWPHLAFAALHAHAQRRLMTTTPDLTKVDPGGETIPPLALWYRGQAPLSTLGIRALGVVGSRAMTSYGQHVTTDLSYGLARHDVTIVSGGAYGIDAVAHRSALAAGGATVLVSAAGLDRPYPQANAELFSRVAADGLLVSESPPGAAPQRQRFLSRNRLIAALCTATVIVEAARRSGALNTAKHCRNLGRPVLAVPGPVTSAMSAGCHDLLRREQDPAILVSSIEDVLAIVGSSGEGLSEPAGNDAPEGDLRRTLDHLDATARRVFDGLPARGGVGEDELARRSGVSPIEVIRALPALRNAGLVDSTESGWVLQRAPRRSKPSRPRPAGE